MTVLPVQLNLLIKSINLQGFAVITGKIVFQGDGSGNARSNSRKRELREGRM
jgi:hypothetical protein